MKEPPAWFDRTFTVPYSVDLLPLLLARLRGTPARLEEMTRACTREQLTTKARGRWSGQENAGHLLDLESLWLTRVDDYVAGRAKLSAADLTNRGTDGADHNARSLDHLLAAFREARGRLLMRVEGLDASSFATALAHPRLGTPMKLADHLSFVAEHDDHHLARIWSLCRKHTP